MKLFRSEIPCFEMKCQGADASSFGICNLRIIVFLEYPVESDSDKRVRSSSPTSTRSRQNSTYSMKSRKSQRARSLSNESNGSASDRSRRNSPVKSRKSMFKGLVNLVVTINCQKFFKILNLKGKNDFMKD